MSDEKYQELEEKLEKTKIFLTALIAISMSRSVEFDAKLSLLWTAVFWHSSGDSVRFSETHQDWLKSPERELEIRQCRKDLIEAIRKYSQGNLDKIHQELIDGLLKDSFDLELSHQNISVTALQKISNLTDQNSNFFVMEGQETSSLQQPPLNSISATLNSSSIIPLGVDRKEVENSINEDKNLGIIEVAFVVGGMIGMMIWGGFLDRVDSTFGALLGVTVGAVVGSITGTKLGVVMGAILGACSFALLFAG